MFVLDAPHRSAKASVHIIQYFSRVLPTDIQLQDVFLSSK